MHICRKFPCSSCVQLSLGREEYIIGIFLVCFSVLSVRIILDTACYRSMVGSWARVWGNLSRVSKKFIHKNAVFFQTMFLAQIPPPPPPQPHHVLLYLLSFTYIIMHSVSIDTYGSKVGCTCGCMLGLIEGRLKAGGWAEVDRTGGTHSSWAFFTSACWPQVVDCRVIVRSVGENTAKKQWEGQHPVPTSQRMLLWTLCFKTSRLHTWWL